MAKKRKKKTLRESKKYPNLEPSVNLRTRTDLIDYDYIDKLSDKDKKWLDKFTKEYTNADLSDKKKLHKTDALKKDCYDRNNARNRCILTRAKASGAAFYLEDLNEEQFVNQDFEDKVINKVDKDNLKKYFLEQQRLNLKKATDDPDDNGNKS